MALTMISIHSHKNFTAKPLSFLNGSGLRLAAVSPGGDHTEITIYGKASDVARFIRIAASINEAFAAHPASEEVADQQVETA